MPVGTRLVLALGWKLLPHSPSLRERLLNTLNSTGLPMSTTQEGLATSEKSVLVAVDIQLSSLQEPTSEISAASTANAPLAARASSAIGSSAMAAEAANAMPPAQRPMRRS